MHTALVIEDVSTSRMIFERMLTKLGFNVMLAGEAATALRLCREAMPDVVLVDLNLAEMDGITFVIEMRKLPGGDRPKVVMCSVDSTPKHMERAFAAGVNEYLAKPFTTENLARKLAMPYPNS